jgi:NADH:ubiquinone oxidoreductase subunit E
LHILDIMENSVAAGATRVDVTVAELPADNRLEIVVDDDGRGLTVNPERALDPFFTTKEGKRTGLGLTLFRTAAEQAGGGLSLVARPEGGASVRVHMVLDHIDRVPMGDLGATMASIACLHSNVELSCKLRFDGSFVTVTASEIAARLPKGRGDILAFAGAFSRAVNESLSEVGGARPDGVTHVKGEHGEPAATACQCEEPATEAELLARLDTAIAEHRGRAGALIPVLQVAQALFGYVSEAAMQRIARGLGTSLSEVAGVVGFYSYFSTVPRGRHLIRVCLGTACYVRGGKAVLDAFRQKLGIGIGGTTPDRLFSLEVARCFGACGLAPAIMVDDTVHHRVKAARVQLILNQYGEATGAAPTNQKVQDVQANQ